MIIDSIIYYGSGTKLGDILTASQDFDSADLRRFVRRNDFERSMTFRTEIVTQREVTDAEGVILTPKAVMAGYALWVQCWDQKQADALWALPNNLCRLQLDRDKGSVIRRKMTLAVLRTLALDPVVAGSHYTFSSIS